MMVLPSALNIGLWSASSSSLEHPPTVGLLERGEIDSAAER
jgi:hypothetical protein